MPEGLSAATMQGYYAATFQQTAFAVDEVWMQPHLGAPGADGTANPCVDTTRMEATTCFGTDPVVDTGTLTGSNDAAVGPWTTGAELEDPTHFSLWAGETSTFFVGSGTIDGLDDTGSIPVGGCTVIYPTAT